MEPLGCGQGKLRSAETVDGDEYLTAESDTKSECLPEDIDPYKNLGIELFLSSNKLSVSKFNYLSGQLSPSPSNSVFDHSSCIGLVLVPKRKAQRSQIEYVPLNQNQLSSVSFLTFLNSQNFEIVQSCNGLLLCLSLINHSYYICNPSTRQSKLLSGSPYMDNHFVLNLAFDPVSSPHYSVVRVKRLSRQNPLHQIAIYSSVTCSWSSSGEPFLASGDIDFQDGVFCNGAIHWMRGTSKGLYFDVNRQCLGEMPKPPLREGCSFVHCKHFGKSQGCLHYVAGYEDPQYYEVFEMKRDYSGWILKFRIDLKVVASDFPIVARNLENLNPFFPRYECDVLYIAHGRSKNHFEIFLCIPGEVIAYNPEDESTQKVCNLRQLPRDYSVWLSVYTVHEILGSHC